MGPDKMLYSRASHNLTSRDSRAEGLLERKAHPTALYEDGPQIGAANIGFHGRAQALCQAADEVQRADDKLLLGLEGLPVLPVGHARCRIAGRMLHRENSHAPVKGGLRIRLIRRPCTAHALSINTRLYLTSLSCSMPDMCHEVKSTGPHKESHGLG